MRLLAYQDRPGDGKDEEAKAENWREGGLGALL
jgi:hypothetical protein